MTPSQKNLAAREIRGASQSRLCLSLSRCLPKGTWLVSEVILHPHWSPHPFLSQDALRAKRNQEVADREWRRKEKENAQKKVETEARLRKSRLEQVAFKEHTLAVQVQRDRDEFERILR